MHPLFVLVYMRDAQENRPFEHIASVTPPRGLFSRIIKRLGLEKELLLVKRHLGFFTTLLVIFIVLSAFAFIGVKHVLAESSFGPFLSLIFSDPGMVITYWHSYALAVSEAVPGSVMTGFLAALGFLMLSAKLVGVYYDKFSNIKKTINKN